jgi:hypothetical protein
MWKGEKSPPQDPGTKHRNLGHPPNNIDTSRSQNFIYDQLSRITGALTTSTHATSPTHCWGESYTLDAWANLNSIAATTNSAYTGCTQESGFSQTASTSNKLPGFAYDASGNATGDGVNTYTWGAESLLKVAANMTYLYDGDGRRVAKASTANPPVPFKFYWFGAGGDILAETAGTGALQNEYVFFGGSRIALVPAAGNPNYYVEVIV